ncbi:MAG: hypothetical protein NZ926_00130 [Candidatus Methanomethylicia archaeon]|nr:hypothetical protein [Candidatus Methanomethylicia archaeon]MCX8168842.1 hypothetical protein [Candidatus Methanomethylicia archaeon]MDW7988574.1 hypothetical protein [Nitrososphaerota archaeon]
MIIHQYNLKNIKTQYLGSIWLVNIIIVPSSFTSFKCLTTCRKTDIDTRST